MTAPSQLTTSSRLPHGALSIRTHLRMVTAYHHSLDVATIATAITTCCSPLVADQLILQTKQASRLLIEQHSGAIAFCRNSVDVPWAVTPKSLSSIAPAKQVLPRQLSPPHAPKVRSGQVAAGVMPCGTPSAQLSVCVLNCFLTP